MGIETSGKFSIRASDKNYKIEIVNHINYDDLSFIVHNIDRIEMGTNRNTFEKLGEGSYGTVYGYKNYAIKRLYDSDFDNKGYCNDIQALKDLAHLDCIPSLYAVINNDVIITERIFGVTVDEYCNGYHYEGNKSLINESFVRKWDEALFNVILNGYSPEDLHESNVMIEFETCRPMFIDLGFFRKHNTSYDFNDEDSIRSNEGYSKANRWTGKTIREYVDSYASI